MYNKAMQPGSKLELQHSKLKLLNTATIKNNRKANYLNVQITNSNITNTHDDSTYLLFFEKIFKMRF